MKNKKILNYLLLTTITLNQIGITAVVRAENVPIEADRVDQLFPQTRATDYEAPFSNVDELMEYETLYNGAYIWNIFSQLYPYDEEMMEELGWEVLPGLSAPLDFWQLIINKVEQGENAENNRGVLTLENKDGATIKLRLENYDTGLTKIMSEDRELHNAAVTNHTERYKAGKLKQTVGEETQTEFYNDDQSIKINFEKVSDEESYLTVTRIKKDGSKDLIFNVLSSFLLEIEKGGAITTLDTEDERTDPLKVGDTVSYYGSAYSIEGEAQVDFTQLITIVDDMRELTVQDITIPKGSTWNYHDNIVSIISPTGVAGDKSEVTIEGEVNTDVAGEYEVIFRYQGILKTAKVIVESAKTELSTSDSVIKSSDGWKPADNFTKLVTDQGVEITNYDEAVRAGLEVEHDIDLNNLPLGVDSVEKKVTYKYQDQIKEVTVTINKHAYIETTDTVIKQYEDWQPENRVKVWDDTGKVVPFEEITFDNTVDEKIIGTYNVPFTYNGLSKSAKVEVVASPVRIEAKNKEVYVSSTETISPSEAFTSFTTPNDIILSSYDEALANGMSTVIYNENMGLVEQIDRTKVGTYIVNFSYGSYSKEVEINVKADLTDIDVPEEFVLNVGETFNPENLILKAVDKDGNPILTSQIIIDSNVDTNVAGEYLVTYTYDNKSFQTIVKVIEDGTGAIEPHVIVVSYVDEKGTKIHEQTTLKGKVGEQYEAEAITIPGYSLKEMPSNATGIFGEGPDEIVYIYTPNQGGKITVQYVDENGTPIQESTVLEGKYKESYQAKAIDIEGYGLKIIPDNTDGIFSLEEQIVTFVYAKLPATNIELILVKYVDEDGQPISDVDVLKGKEGSPYEANAKNIKGYELVSKDEIVTGSFAKGTDEIIFQYRRLEGAPVTVYYVDEEGNEVAPPEILEGKQLDSYTANPVQVEGYGLKVIPNNASGVFGDEEQIVTYIYTKLPITDIQSVIVKFLDTNGNQVSDPMTLKGKVGDEYQASAIEIPGYKLVSTDKQVNGYFSQNGSEVTFLYSVDEAAPVTVNFVDETGQPVADPVVLVGSYLESYEAQAKNIEGFGLKEVPDNVKGQFILEPQTVTFVYSSLPSVDINTVIVKYIDSDGKEIFDRSVLRGKTGESYNTNAIEIPGYELVNGDSQITGVFGNSTELIQYEYKRIPSEAVTVRYMDDEGNEVASNEILVGNYLESYIAKAKEIEGYGLKEIPNNTNGVFVKEKQTVTFIYAKIPNQDIQAIVVKYVDNNNKEIAGVHTLLGKIGDEFKSNSLEIPGYKLISSNQQVLGVFGDGTQEIVYEYERLGGAFITVEFVDESGKELAPSEVLTGTYLDSYQAKAKEFEGYGLKEIPSNANGQFELSPQKVTFVYAELPSVGINTVIVKYIDKDRNGEKIAENITLKGRIGDSYKSDAMDIPGYELVSNDSQVLGAFGDGIESIIYEYKRVLGKEITVKYVDENGNELTERNILTGYYLEPFMAKAKEIEGYGLKNIPNNTHGVFSLENQQVTFVYAKIPDVDIQGIIVKYVDKNGKELAGAHTLLGKVGETYESNALLIPGYKLTNSVSEVSGVFGDGTEKINYVYERLPGAPVKVYHIDENGKEIAAPETLVGENLQTYMAKAKKIDGYGLKEIPDNTNGIFTLHEQVVVFVYAAIPNKGIESIVVKFVDENDNEIAERVTFKGEFGKEYLANAKEIPGYELISEYKEVVGIFGEAEGEVIFHYRKIAEVITPDETEKNEDILETEDSVDEQIIEEEPSDKEPNKNNALPQTGEKKSNLIVFGMGIVLAISYVLVRKREKK